MSETEHTPSPDSRGNPPSGRERQAERWWAWMVALLAVAATMLPYLAGDANADGRRFMWLGYNLDDSCAYLALMRQAADGSTRALNLFTTDFQHGLAMNPLFLVLGKIAGYGHIPLIGVYHGARILFGLGLLRCAWDFVELTVADRRARKVGFLFIAFTAGLGWLPLWWGDPPIRTPIDKWQPEAITFLSLYLSPLFCFALLLQVAILNLLLRAARSGSVRCTVAAGLCGLLLGAVHTYDVVSVGAVWLVFVALRLLARDSPGSRGRLVVQAVTAGALTLPSVLSKYLELRSEAVFRERALVPTMSPSPVWILAGYGLAALFAIAGAAALMRSRGPSDAAPPETGRKRWVSGADASTLLAVWAMVNLLVAYIPTPIQRKLLQGEHLPVSILAGIGAVWVLEGLKPTAGRWRFALKCAALTLVMSLTNILFMLRDVWNYQQNLSQTGLQRTYLQPGEIEALEWVRDHSLPTDAVQPLGWITRVGQRSIRTSDEALACFAPGLIDRRVYCGHWGETPNFPAKLKDLQDVELGNTPDSVRQGLIRTMKVRYLVFSQKPPRDTSSDDTAFADVALRIFRGHAPLPPYLVLVHSNEDADVYEVTPAR